MTSDLLTAGLGRYKIGGKVRALRAKKKLGLVQLGEHTGLSPGMLSKIERGQLFPTLPTLLRIALVFDVGLDHFFAEGQRRPLAVVRKGERLRLPDQPGRTPAAYFFESLDFPMSNRRIQSYYAEFPEQPTPASEPHAHDGEELVYVLAGQLLVSVDGIDVPLDEGDALHFDSGVPHTYRGRGNALCKAIVVIAP